MAWTLVQKSAAVATGTGGNVTGTLPAGTTAGNPLVAVVGSNVAGTQFLGGIGWVQAAQIGNGSLSRAEIWWCPPAVNTGGFTSFGFVCGTGNVRCAVAEFHNDVAGATISVGSSGTGVASAVTTDQASASAAAGDLAVCAFLEHLGTASAVTWTDPAGFTLLDSMTASGSNQLYSAYQLSAAAGTLSVMATSSVAAATNGWTGCVATLKAVAPASQPVSVGATINTNDYPAGTTRPQAQLAFAATVGRPGQVIKLYYVLGPVSPSGTVNLADHDIATWIARGVKCLLCFSPSFNPTSLSDFVNLQTTLAAYNAAGLNAEVALWQEPSNATKNLSPSQYGAMIQFYKAAVTPYYPLVASLNYSGAAGDPQNFVNYWNSVPAGTFAKGYMDFYAREWSAKNPATLDGAAAAVDAQGVPFGIAEWGCNPQIDGIPTCIGFMQYVTNFLTARVAAGQLISDLIWYGGPGPGNSLALPITSPPQPGCTLPGQTTDARIPYYQQAFDALTSTAAQQVTVAVTRKITATTSATATGGNAPAPPPVTPPWAGILPQVIAQIGVTPATPVPAPGTFLLGDPTFGLLNLDTLGGATSWVDVAATGFFRSGTITRPSSRQNAPVITYDAGTLSVVLNNADGRFDPDNLAGPYVAAGASQIRPMVPVRIQAVYAGVIYPLFSGFADSWITPPVSWGPAYSEITLSATDAFKVLTGFQLGAAAAALSGGTQLPAGFGEDTGARISRLLNLAGWSVNDRLIDTGNTSLQGTMLAAGDALSEMRLAVDTELGELYVNGAGQVVFRRRHGVLEDARSITPQAVFGDQPGPGAQLNSNPSFEAGVTGWQAQNGAALTQTSALAYAGSFAGLLAPDGVTASPQIATLPAAAVTPGTYVTFSAWLQATGGADIYLASYTSAYPGGVGTPWVCKAALHFFDGGGAHLAGQDVTVSQTVAGSWVQLAAAGFVPAGAATVQGFVQMAGIPAPTTLIAVDEAYLTVAAELDYVALTRANDETQLCNDAQITAAGSANLQEAQDAPSVATFLYPRSYSRTDLLLLSDAEALATAQFLVWLSKGAEDRFDAITLSPLKDRARLFPQALGREIGDMIAVIRRPPGMAPVLKKLIIRGVSHSIQASPADWQTTWTLQDASRYSFMKLNDPAAGALGGSGLGY